MTPKSLQYRFAQEQDREQVVLNHFLIYLLMGVSSMPILFGNEFLIAGFLLTGIVFFMKSKRFDRVIVSYNLIFLALFGLHVLVYDKFILGVLVAYFMRIYFAYFTVRIIGPNIDKYVVNQIYFFSIISLVVTFAIFINPALADYINSNIVPFFDQITLFQPNRKHFILYTMELGWKVEIPRNSGPFWEPGGFVIFLFIAFTFNIVRTKKIISKKNIIFLIAILTTQSTTGYLALFVFICVYIIISYKKIYTIISVPILILLFMNVYSQLDFMEEKVNKMYNESKTAGKQKVYSRIVSGQVNFQNFLSSPMFGIGRFFEIAEEENSGNNGTTLLLAEFGLIGFGYYFLMMIFSYRRYCKIHDYNPNYALAVVAGLLVLGFSQGIFQKPFFMGLCFMFLVKVDKHKMLAVEVLRNKMMFLKKHGRLA
jgi:hypothetical protein